LWLPGGPHVVEAVEGFQRGLQVIYLNGELKSAQVITSTKIQVSYESAARAIAILNRAPIRVQIDGVETIPSLAGATAIFLPAGQHVATLMSK
jgi:hypothetical protein